MILVTFSNNYFFGVEYSGQNLFWTHEADKILTTVMTNIVVDKSTDNAEPLSICLCPLLGMF